MSIKECKKTCGSGYHCNTISGRCNKDKVVKEKTRSNALKEHACSDKKCTVKTTDKTVFGCSNMVVKGRCKGPYKSGKEVGSGKFATVYTVTNGKDEFVFKHIKKISDYDEKEFKLQEEAAKFKCAPKILQVIFSKQDGAGIIIEKMEETLEDILNNIVEENEDEEKQQIEILKIMRAVSRKLIKLHSIGIAHGDIHLENIMKTKSNNLVFIDFGMAGKKSEKTANDDFVQFIMMFMQFVTDTYGEDVYKKMSLSRLFPSLKKNVSKDTFDEMKSIREAMQE